MPNQERCLCRSWIVQALLQGLSQYFLFYSVNSSIILMDSKHCSIGMPTVNGSAPAQQASLPIGNPGIIPVPTLPTQIMPTQVAEPVGNPSECLLLKNMFDPTTEVRIAWLIIIISYVSFNRTKYQMLPYADRTRF